MKFFWLSFLHDTNNSIMKNNGRNSAINDSLSISVVIPTYNRESVLVETVQQVLDQCPSADEVLVVDQTNHHEAETELFLGKAHGERKLRWIRHNPPNLNKARNRALVETHCEIAIFIDDDVVLCEKFIDNHRKNYMDPGVIAVAGRTLQARGNTPAEKASPWLKFLGVSVLAFNEVSRLEGIASFIGANHSVRVSHILELGGYDENFDGPMYDEADLALRMWKAKMKIVFDPEAELYHLQENSGGVREKAGANRHPEWWWSYSAVYFHWKHFFPHIYFWKMICFKYFRNSVLRKDNILHPWRLPWAGISYGISIAKTCLNIYGHNN